VSSRTLRHWEHGKYAIPAGIRQDVEDLKRRTGEFVSGIIDQMMDVPDPVVVTYRDDAEYHAAHPGVEFPASWHRAAIARVAQEVPALSIVFASDVPGVAAEAAAAHRTGPARSKG
jgi:hypothetical protein